MLQAHPFNARLAVRPQPIVSTMRRDGALRGFSQTAPSDRLTFSGLSQVVRLDGIHPQQAMPKVLGTESEIPALVDFIRKMFGNTPVTKTRADSVNYYSQGFRKGSFTYTVFTPDSRKLIGTASLTPDGYIHSVCVHPDHRRQKLARAMMQGLMQEAERRTLRKVYLNADNPHAIALYKSLGFQVVGPTGKPEELIMELKLRSRTAAIWRWFQTACSKFRNFLNDIWQRVKRLFNGK